MPFYETPYPHVTNSLFGPTSPETTYLVFYSSVDPASGQMWCPDCRDVETLVRDSFSPSDAPKAMVHWVGQRAEWRTPENEARKVWNVNNVPTILKLEKGKEAGRLVENDITASGLAQFIKK